MDWYYAAKSWPRDPEDTDYQGFEPWSIYRFSSSEERGCWIKNHQEQVRKVDDVFVDHILGKENEYPRYSSETSEVISTKDHISRECIDEALQKRKACIERMKLVYNECENMGKRLPPDILDPTSFCYEKLSNEYDGIAGKKYLATKIGRPFMKYLCKVETIESNFLAFNEYVLSRIYLGVGIKVPKPKIFKVTEDCVGFKEYYDYLPHVFASQYVRNIKQKLRYPTNDLMRESKKNSIFFIQSLILHNILGGGDYPEYLLTTENAIYCIDFELGISVNLLNLAFDLTNYKKLEEELQIRFQNALKNQDFRDLWEINQPDLKYDDCVKNLSVKIAALSRDNMQRTVKTIRYVYGFHKSEVVRNLYKSLQYSAESFIRNSLTVPPFWN